MAEDGDRRALAEAVGADFEDGDRFAKSLGITLVDIRPGHARVTMTIGVGMTNPSGISHGGVLFTLADTALGYACNSRNAMSLATQCAITYLLPAEVGDTLTAKATESALEGRNGVYDVKISNQDGQVIALFRGQSRRVRGQLVAGLGGAMDS